MIAKEAWKGPEAQAAYADLLSGAEALLSAETDWLANLANAAALVYNALPDLNWAGFYLNKRNELVLGPFQGKPACVRIPWGRGYAAQLPSGGRQSWCLMYISFPAISLATQLPVRRSWCPLFTVIMCGESLI